MTQYDLKVDLSLLTTTGSQLTVLSPTAADGPTLGIITTQESSGTVGNVGTGVCAFNAAVVYLTKATIKRLHSRVNDNNANKHVSVQFSVSSSGALSGFEHSYST
jgi:hypothetical protein